MKKTNKFAKILALVVAVIMTFCMAVTAFAAETGSITINNATAGKSYDLYKILDLKKTDSNGKITYSIDADWTAFFTTGEGKNFLVDTSTELNQVELNGKLVYLNISESNVDAFSKAALDYATKLTADKTVVCADGTASVVADGLDLGYYLVLPRGASDIKDGYKSICSLTSTTPDATVEVKAEYPTIEKEADNYSVEIGQIVNYTIKGSVPDTTGYAKYRYIVTDKMSAGLTFNKDVTVKFGDTVIDVADLIDYDTVENGFVLEFDMTKYQALAGEDIVIEYTATVNEDAVNYDKLTNEAKLEYSNNPSDTDETEPAPPEVVEVYSAKIVIDKIDGATKDKLAGAKFVLQNAEGKYYALSEDGNVIWVDSIADALEVTTDENGFAQFTGLAAGTYELVETAAPEGYNKLESSIKITISENDFNADNTQKVVYNTEIENYSGTELPGTGGIGTTIFYIVGGALVVGAAVLFIARKKVKASEK